MMINKTQNGETVTLTLAGSLDTATAPQLFDALPPLFDEARQVILDLAALSYVSSAGLRVLLQAEKTAMAKGRKMTLRHVSEEVMEVFEMTGFSDILNIET
jgi:anti-anti-sigma factor